MPKKRNRTRPNKHKRASFFRQFSLPALFLIAGFTLIMVSFGVWYYQPRVLSFDQGYTPTIEEEGSIPTSLSIPDLHIDLTILPSRIVKGVWEINPNGVSYLATSARPGTQGNIILYGHNKRELLGNLKHVEKGQKIRIITEDGIVHSYTVDTVQIVRPDHMEIVSPTSRELLTLYTCIGILDSKRLVVQAVPVTLSYK